MAMQEFHVARVTDREYGAIYKAWIERYPINWPGTLTATLVDVRDVDGDKNVAIAALSQDDAKVLTEFLRQELNRFRAGLSLPTARTTFEADRI